MLSGHKNKHAIICAWHDVLTAVLLKFQVFWDVMLCNGACNPDILNGNIRNCKTNDTVSRPKRLESSCSSSCKCYIHCCSCSSLYLWVPFPVTYSIATPGLQATVWKKVPWTLGWGVLCCKFVLHTLWKAYLMIKFLCWLVSIFIQQHI